MTDELLKLRKIDLHRHLLGSTSPKTYLRIVKKYGLELPVNSIAELDSLLTIREPVAGLREFFRPWKHLSRLIISPEALFEIAYDAFADEARDNVCYVEMRASSANAS